MFRLNHTLKPVAILLLTFLISGCEPQDANKKTDTLKIGGYSVIKEAFHEGILPAFAERWKKETGREVRFEESYNASGAQARSIASGFDADIAILSHRGDVDSLVKAGRVGSDWDEGPTKGIITRSLVVIGHRPGNPKKIHDWPDLAKPDVGVLYPDPQTSGGARWNINAIYGSALLASKEANNGKDDLDAVGELLAKIQGNVVNMDASGRQSVASFERGTGDALVTYENELLLRNKAGEPIPYVVPPATLVIEGPAALVETSIEKHNNRALAEAFLAFLASADAQRILAEYGFRPADPEVKAAVGAPLPPKVFTMDDLGGWDKVQGELYGPEGLWTSIFHAQTKGR